jgi:two-component system sensor histidine kinase QseC
VLTTTNALLARLDHAFQREQRFSADAAHELRTPISALKIQVHNLQQSGNIKDETLSSLSAGIDRMAHVIEQILALYRHSPDQALVTLSPIELCRVAQDVIANLYDSIEAKQQQISLEGSTHCQILGNRFALETLLENLILNANKYTPNESEIILTISNKNNLVTVTLEDSGSGINEADYERVFERFYRANGDQHDSGYEGCGLGLSIVKHIVSIHHGTISLSRSEHLGGLKTIIQFPMLKQTDI